MSNQDRVFQCMRRRFHRSRHDGTAALSTIERPQYTCAGLRWGCSPSAVIKTMARHHRTVVIGFSEIGGTLTFGARPGDSTNGCHVIGEARFPDGFLTSVTLTTTIEPYVNVAPAELFVKLVRRDEDQYGPRDQSIVQEPLHIRWPSDERGSLSVDLDPDPGEVRSHYGSGVIG